MKCLPINVNAGVNSTPNFGSRLVVDKSVKNVIALNKTAFVRAAEKYDEWLKNEKWYVDAPMIIRKNPAEHPNVAIEHRVTVTDYVYPFEETGYTHSEMRKEYENLEFELNGKKCGFWFDRNCNEHNLLTYFKNMFSHLIQG